ncbi:MAG: MBL fold metallo-hydrolase [Candidatus Moranbacteria bacterium]|nr:MBL fold metallo-hydrolase [Candidatus Moranbacteria bacterium]
MYVIRLPAGRQVIRKEIVNIQYYGHSCFKITTKPAGRATEDVVIFTDPFDRSIGLRSPQGHADIVFVSHDHYDHNNTSALKNGPLVIDLPGEYSARGINAVGIDTFHDEKGGEERGHSTVFVIESEEMKICHLGDLGTDLTSEQLEEIDGIDVLFIPVGGKITLDGKKAAELVRKIEPAIVIPMHYKIKGSAIDIADEKKFCAEMGNCPSQKSNKLSFKKRDLEEKSMEVVIMSVE